MSQEGAEGQPRDFAGQLHEIRKLRNLLGPPGYGLRSPYERPKLYCHCACRGCAADPERRFHCLDARRGCQQRF